MLCVYTFVFTVVFKARGVAVEDDNKIGFAIFLFSGLILPYDNNGHEDGVLRVDEISQLELNRSVIVLSSCNSGLGKNITGEGIYGLSRSFLLAGARSLVVSLWPIDDKISAHAFEHFYQNIIEGKSVSNSLFDTRRWMIQETIFKHPYYWAPFVLIGDWE